MYKENSWKKYSNEDLTELNSLCSDYKDFISQCKTERLCVKKAIKLAEEKGFKPISSYKILKENDKVYFVNRDKNIILYVIGQKPITDGLRILGAHIDSPRIDLKQNPLYEDEGFAMLDTHYYGGIKKYQWVTLPLAIYGVVYKKDGKKIEISIGDNPNDPVFGIDDLLIHLSGDQLQKKALNVIEGEDLDIVFGNIPLKTKEKEAVKANILDIMKKTYDIDEEDFISAELEVVPAFEARDFGIDRSMIMGYGQDDRSCAYTSLRAILDINNPEYTSCCVLVDKEEVGSIGATGAHSYFFENTVLELLNIINKTSILDLRTTLNKSKMLSSDVTNGVDPLFASLSDKKNAAYLGNGVMLNKYTGVRGKSGSNDANPDYIAWLRKIFDENNINFQTAELGKVDVGGGGTIAYILGNYNIDVIDCGIAVLNMHAPWEIISKADVFETYNAYKVFLKK